ncbi:DNA-binding protein [Desulfosarcina ovata subsp. sediminis]|uniref:DNA-binding protein n=1 Tax=Desulfosarcina ovata subsp. sediminis TaxID=885957 RepID=A0A5K7ZXC0_9BACT|nr:CLJU_RS11820 family redox protein [Desulfosarcina ovata]BBO84878.1 DNA-binding protein [Desulfosarcina ovata subsp. sediminis]
MKIDNVRPEDLKWRCDRCGCDLVVGPVAVAYMGNRFTTDLPYCPECKTVLISEAVATGKMAEVERILEDK